MSDNRGTIQARLLNNIDNKYDKSEGGFFYDAEKPVSIELESAYVTLDNMLDKYFADSASGLNLDRIVKNVGLTRKYATKATGIVTITGTIGSTITKGEKVASDSINYLFTDTNIISTSGTIDVNVQCEVVGQKGNVPIGAIKYFPKTLQGLQAVTNKSAFVNGYDEELDIDLKERYYTKVRTPATSGNVYHYLNWSKEVTGVGDARVIPLANGNGTVKVVIINSNKAGADATLINSVKAHIEEERPIGATVSVISAIEVPINISVSLVVDNLIATKDQIKLNIESEIKAYLKAIAFNDTYISYAKIGAILLGTTGVKDYSNLKINNNTTNVNIADTEVATFGGVTIV